MLFISHARLLATRWTSGSSIHGIFQARVLEWVAIAFSDLSQFEHINSNMIHKDKNI